MFDDVASYKIWIYSCMDSLKNYVRIPSVHHAAYRRRRLRPTYTRRFPPFRRTKFCAFLSMFLFIPLYLFQPEKLPALQLVEFPLDVRDRVLQLGEVWKRP